MSKKKKWMVGNREFPTKKEAEEAEKEVKILEKIDENKSYFKTYFKTVYNEINQDNDPYVYLCVDCGKKLFGSEKRWDGQSREKGKNVNFSAYYRFMGGWRCWSCHTKIIELFEHMSKYYKKRTGIDLITDHPCPPDLYSLDLETRLNIILMAKEWSEKENDNL